MTAKQHGLKKYIVRLSDDERAQLNALIGKGKHSAQKLLRARILLKADASEAGPGWPDRDIAAALDTSIDTVAKARQLLVEEGLDGALTRKHSPASARRRIFDGAAEAKLIALACSAPPSGRTRWTLELLEEAVVELKIVDRASDNTIGRILKKHAQASSAKAMGNSAGRQRRLRRRHGGRARGLPSAAQSCIPGRLPGRDVKATHRRNPLAHPRQAGQPSATRL